MNPDDTLAHINDAIDGWELGRDAARWTPQGAVEPEPRKPRPPQPATYPEPSRAALAHALAIRSITSLLHRGSW